MLARATPSGFAVPYNFSPTFGDFFSVQERVFMWSILRIRHLKG